MPVSLTIDKLINGGEGLARQEGRTFFVSGVIPGETVTAQVYGKKARCLLARVVDILEPSADRISPPCPHVPHCGGCVWQHIAYARQVALKKEIFLDCMRRIGKIAAFPDPEVIAGPSVGYRHRVQFKVDPAKKAIGFFRRDSNAVVDIGTCAVLVPELNRFLSGIRQGSFPACAQIRAIAGTDGTVASDPASGDIGTDTTTIIIHGVRFTLRGGSFFQQNRPLAPVLAAWVRDHAQGESLLDLYGGIGLFSALCAPRFGRVTLVESVDEQARLARGVFAANGLTNCTAVASMAERYFASACECPTCVIIDPPRTGLTPIVRDALGGMRVPTLICVSCDPATQARDVGHLVSTCGYRIDKAALFDLYPQTPHMESVIILKQ